jgi:hypothetical protein
VTVLPLGRIGGQLAAGNALDELQLFTGGAGLVLGVNQNGDPVTLRLFRPEPTRMVIVGGLRFAQMVAFRALALGAQVIIQSARPAAWGTFARVMSSPNDAIRLVPPGTVLDQSPNQSRPRLVVQDSGPSVGAQHTGRTGWSVTMSVREELTAWDVDVLGVADLVLMQPLTPTEAELAASVLGLTEMKQSLSGIRADLVTVVSQGTVRWTLIAPTSVERQLIGVPTRG